MPSDRSELEDDSGVWNQDDADWLLGKYALVGITHDAVALELVPPGAPIRVVARVGDSLAARRAVLHYRCTGQVAFT